MSAVAPPDAFHGPPPDTIQVAVYIYPRTYRWTRPRNTKFKNELRTRKEIEKAVNEQSPIQTLQNNSVHRSAKFQTTEIQKIGSEGGYGA